MFNVKKQKYPDQGIRPEKHRLHIQYRKKITKNNKERLRKRVRYFFATHHAKASRNPGVNPMNKLMH